MRAPAHQIPDFDCPVLKASHDEGLGLVSILATALASVPDGDAMLITSLVPLSSSSSSWLSASYTKMALPELLTMRVALTATELTAFVCDSVKMHASFSWDLLRHLSARVGCMDDSCEAARNTALAFGCCRAS